MKVLRAMIAMVVAVLSAIGAYDLLFRALGPVNTWYAHRFVEPSELKPLYPPLMWMDFTVLPLLASALGGLLSGVIFRSQSRGRAACVGSAMMVTYFWFYHRAASVDPLLYAVGLACGVLSGLTTNWGQKKRAEGSVLHND